MAKSDDSTLDADQLRAVQQRAQALLDRAAAWNRFPTPIDDLLSAADIRIAPKSAFDPASILAFLRTKAASAAVNLKAAITKVFGILDAGDGIIHIDDTVSVSKQTFLKLHETGHHQIPWHRKLFRVFQDCEKTLAPEVSDLFEREANNFARFVLFQGDGYGRMASDHAMEIRTPMKLAKKFGASVYASCREFARTHHRACIVYVLEPIEFCERSGATAKVRRIESSPAFEKQFGKQTDLAISLDHPLGHVLPVGRRMTRARTMMMRDRNNDAHECIVEAFDTTFNILVLLYPVKALSSTTIIMPGAR